MYRRVALVPMARVLLGHDVRGDGRAWQAQALLVARALPVLAPVKSCSMVVVAEAASIVGSVRVMLQRRVSAAHARVEVAAPSNLSAALYHVLL